ncbi:MAG: family 20 glycosylhydrolase [Planctomycetota bacterium]
MAALKHRGLMLDLARGMERKSYYLELLPWLRDWGYNILHLHLLDDQGCRMEFPSRPGLASKGAFTVDEMRTLVCEAARHRIRLIPEIECLGHSSQLKALPCFKDSRTTRHAGPMNALDPEHPETKPLLRDLIADVASIFPDEVLHAGLDEVDFSPVARYRNVPEADHWRIFAKHSAWVHQAIRKHDRRPAMWGDHLLSSREMVKSFAKDVLIFDWHYRPEVDPETLDFLAGSGFETWAAPATMWWYSRLFCSPGNVRNVREFTAHAAQPQQKRVTGVVNTVWCPWRYMAGAMDWPIAWAGHVFSNTQEQDDVCADFCRSFYGLSPGDATTAAAAILVLHELVPDTPRIDGVMNGGIRHTRERVRQCSEALPRVTASVRVLERMEGKARRHGERLHDVVLTAKLVERWAARGAKANRYKLRPAKLSDYEQRWSSERPYPTPIFPAAGKWQHILQLARKLADR